jgi:hypothetical protein
MGESMNWPAPWEPRIIGILRLVALGDRVQMTSDDRKALADDISEILGAWSAREDLNELRSLLGVGDTGRGVKRKASTVLREFEVAAYYLWLEKRDGPKAAMDAVLEGSKNAKGDPLDERSVRTFVKRWRN